MAAKTSLRGRKKTPKETSSRVRTRQTGNRSALHSEPGSADRIIEAATCLFSRRGFDGSSIKEISARANVNIAAINYHFGSKEDLYLHIIERFGEARLSTAQRLLVGPDSYEELRIKLELFLSDALEVFLQNHELCRIVQMEIELLNSRSEDVFRKTFVKLFETLTGFLDRARRNGLIREGIHTKIAAQLLMNQLRQATRTEVVNTRFFGMNIRDEKFRGLWINQTVGIFLAGITHTGASGQNRKQNTQKSPRN